jgi:hypothetical protein
MHMKQTIAAILAAYKDSGRSEIWSKNSIFVTMALAKVAFNRRSGIIRACL